MQDQPSHADAASVLHPLRRPANTSSPIFVLGSVRSGTSAMGYALTQGAGIPGHDEGHVSTLLQAMLNAADLVASNFPGSGGRYLLDQFDTPALRTHVINYFQAFFEQRYPEGRWCDKTPSDFDGAPAVRVAPLLLEMFPNARFIYCQRRGIENVLSRVTKFPQTPFWYHCHSWATTILAWHEVRARLGDRWIEVRQEQMALEPEKVSDELAAFLGLSAEQRDGVLRTFLKDRPEQTRPAGEGHELSMKEAGWDPGRQGVFLNECATAMALAGYSIEASNSPTEHGLKLFRSTSEGAQGTSLMGLPREAHVARTRDEFTLGPGAPGRRGSLQYSDFRLAGRRHFRSRVVLEGPAGLEVEFG
ncbi:MAG: sulfotransferase family protein, partial [Planctomycetota bacterium]